MKKILLILPVLIVIISGCSLWTEQEKPNQSETVVVEEEKNDDKMDEEMLEDGYFVDMDETKVSWFGEKILGFSHTGTVSVKESSVVFNELDAFKNSRFVLDMMSIEESKDNEAVEKHLKSADFFDVDKYPTAEIVITKVANLGDGKYSMKADLTIKEITHEVEFDSQVVINNDDSIKASTEFSIDRSKWDIRFGSDSFFDNLGDKAIKDEIVFTIDLVVNKK